MICQRSGYCCIHLDVIIVDDPEKGIVEGNLKHKESGVNCQHLSGDSPGKHSCSIHDREWFNETPCAEYTQIGPEDSPCRVGFNIVSKFKLS